MAKNNEFVGVDEKFIPEDKQAKTHTEEPIVGSENVQKVRNGITEGINKLTSDEGKEKAKKGLKVAKRIGIGYLIFWCVLVISVIAIIIVVAVNIIRIQNEQAEMLEDFKNNSNSVIEEYNNTKERMQEEYENSKDEYDKAKEEYDDVESEVQEIYDNTRKEVLKNIE